MSSLNLGPISKVVENYMMDEVTIVRFDDSTTTIHPTTLAIVTASTEIYSGPAFMAPQGQPVPSTLGGREVATTQFELALPKDSPVILPNDEVTITESVYNEGMVGMVFVVQGEIESTFYTHRRVVMWRKEDAS